MDNRCVICDAIIISDPLYHRNRKTCYQIECIKTYKNRRASEADIRRRKAQRYVDELNGRQMVDCAVCGERFPVIQNTHLKSHGLTIAQYRELFPSAPLMTEEMKEIRGKGAIAQSHYLTYPGKQPDAKLFEFLTGSLLGDGSLEKQPKKINARYAEGGNNQLYLQWKYNFLSQYFQCSFKERLSSPHTKSGKCYQGWWIRTTVHPLLTEWQNRWYKGCKVVPQILVSQYLTEFALTVWFCDDGCGTNGAHLYTMAFTDEEVIFLSDLLLSRFGLSNSILKNKQGQPFIRFRAAASRKIKEIINDFKIPGMGYKSQESFAKKRQPKLQNDPLLVPKHHQELPAMTETQQLSIFPPRSVQELVEDIEKLTQEIQELYCSDDIPWIIGVSFGKDSSAVLQLVWYAIAALPPEKRTKIIHVITTDTLVENPIVSAWVRKSIAIVKATAQEKQIPIEPHLLKPEVSQTYWVGLIGKGYPAPRLKFRWCTGRLKIDPSNQFIRNIVRTRGTSILVLGTRKNESVSRGLRMKELEKQRLRERLSPNASLPDSLVYTPIEDWRNDEVWLYLMQWENPWGGNNKDLFTMYRESTADNECPLVVDTSTPSCGSSRFGCWVCTLVDSDKSLSAMIQNDQEKEWLQPLVDFRLELDIEKDRDKRDFRRIYGRVELFERNMGEGETSIEPIPGPYTKYWREHWLRRLLQAQTQIRQTAPPDMGEITLITPEELSEIRRIWLEEKHEFDDSLPKIYQEVTGEPFEDTRPFDERKLLGNDEWDVLQTICENDTMHLELMSKLLNTERQYYTKPRRTGIFLDIDKCFDTSSRIKEEAIDNAHYQRQVKTALETVKEDPHEIQQIREAIATIEDPEKSPDTNPKNIKEMIENKGDKNKQLSWGDMKFPLLNLINENPAE